MNNEIMKLDRIAVEKLNKEIMTLRKELAEISMERGALSTNNTVLGWCANPEARILKNDYAIKEERLRELENLKYELIDEHHIEGCVDINKTYKLLLEYPNGKNLEKTITLVAGIPGESIFNSTPQISLSSPIGKAISGKPIGSKNTFTSPAGNCTVTILEEVYEETNEQI